jgi:hypothetical protein
MSFQGSIVDQGFTMTPEDAKAMIREDKRYKDVLAPFLIGKDFNSNPDQSANRWTINFRDWPLDRPSSPAAYSGPVATDYPKCLQIVRREVKPSRDENKRAARRDKWWHFKEKASGLYSAIRGLKRVIAVSLVSEYLPFAFAPTGTVFAHKLGVIVSDSLRTLAILQSSLHECWARQYGSTLETRLNYSPSDCLLTFPFPSNAADSNRDLEDVAARYDRLRRETMVAEAVGLTTLCSRFHDPDERSSAMRALRRLHAELDDAVKDAYGWKDLICEHGFHETPQGVRYTISAAARLEVLDRFLALNHDRFATELKEGLHPEAKPRNGTTKVGTVTTKERGQAPKRAKRTEPEGQRALLKEEEGT